MTIREAIEQERNCNSRQFRDHHKRQTDETIASYETTLRELVDAAKTVNTYWLDDSSLWGLLESAIKKAEALCGHREPPQPSPPPECPELCAKALDDIRKAYNRGYHDGQGAEK